jgi:hypothetical protein
MRIFMLNGTLRGFHPLIKYDDNPHDQWNWRTHHFLYLGHLDVVLEVNPYPLHCLTFTSYFFILIISNN